MKYILSLLNSKLIDYFYRKNYSLDAGFTITVTKENLNSIPIPKVNQINQKPLIEKTDLIISLSKELQNISQKFQRTLQRNLKIETLPKKFQNWYLLSYNEFLKELSKKKVKLSLADEGSWEDFFISESKRALEIKASIEKTDKEIDTMVYQLYNLTDDEIKIIESTI